MPVAAWRLSVYPSLPSTSAFCCARAAEGAAEGLAVLALAQTQGRGSRGRTWCSPPGGLSLSVVLRPDAPMAQAGQWALLAGLALVDGLAGFLPDPTPLVLKWPNDVLLRGRKLGGVLIDSTADLAGRIGWLVIGFGANLAQTPHLPDRANVAALAEAALAPPPEQAAGAVLDRLAHWYRVWCDDGFDAVRPAWLRHAEPLGTPLRIRLARQEVAGRFAGLRDDGALLLQTAEGLLAYSTGEILAPLPADRRGAWLTAPALPTATRG